MDIDEAPPLSELTQQISIEEIRENEIIGRVSNESQLKKLDFRYTPITLDTKGTYPIADKLDDLQNWDRFPSYSITRKFLQELSERHPDVCHFDSLGKTEGGHSIYYLKISDNVSADENEYEILFSGQIHGDELIGSMLLLQLADSLCNAYSSPENSRIGSILETRELFIIPMLNPDGCYIPSDNDIDKASRYSLYGNDLNRNFPDPAAMAVIDSTQEENRWLMEFIRDRHILLSMSIHGGAEIVNYPWDHRPDLHPFDNWFRSVSRAYADTVHSISGPSYLNMQHPEADDGIIHGWDWYPTYGSLQDYLNYYHQIRDITFEFSNMKMTEPRLFRPIFLYNFDAILNYIEMTAQGFQVTVSDEQTIIPAEIEVNASPLLRFNNQNPDSLIHVLCEAGNYSFRMTDTSLSDSIFTVQVHNDSLSIIHIDISDTNLTSVRNFDGHGTARQLMILRTYPNPFNSMINIELQNATSGKYTISLYNIQGRRYWTEKRYLTASENIHIPIDVSMAGDLSSGIYFLKIRSDRTIVNKKIIHLK